VTAGAKENAALATSAMERVASGIATTTRCLYDALALNITAGPSGKTRPPAIPSFTQVFRPAVPFVAPEDPEVCGAGLGFSFFGFRFSRLPRCSLLAMVLSFELPELRTHPNNDLQPAPRRRPG
jgi:hypothetical protein